MLEWGKVFSSLRTETLEIVIPLTAFVMVGCFLVNYGLVGIAQVAFVAALPILSGISLFLCHADNPYKEPMRPMQVKDTPSIRHAFARICVGAFIVHATNSVCLNLLPSWFATSFGSWYFGPFLTVGAVTGIVLSMLMLSRTVAPDIHTSYRWFLPFLLIACFALTFDTTVMLSVCALCIFAAQIGYSTILYVYLGRIAHTGWRSYSKVFGIARGCCQLGSAFGAPGAFLFATSMDLGIMNKGGVCCAIAALCTIFILLFMNRDSLFFPVFQRPIPSDHTGSCAEEEQPGEAASRPAGFAAIEPTVKLICARRHLTERESEVFGMLAQGKSVTQIREELFISKNTANTHVKNIYRKLNIHSRQELINMVYIGNRAELNNDPKDDNAF